MLHRIHVALSLSITIIVLNVVAVACDNVVDANVPTDRPSHRDTPAPISDPTERDAPALGERDTIVGGELDTLQPAPPQAPDTDPGTDTSASTAPTCGSTAHTGFYCGGDKVNHADADTLYSCHGPGPATVHEACEAGCVVAAAGVDDYCHAVEPSCDDNAHTGYYCAGDKVSHGDDDVLYSCDGPGVATVVHACVSGCVVAPAGSDDYCDSSIAECAHHSQLKYGLAPRQSDHLRCAGVSAGDIMQTIGNASASAGTHAQDGTIDGFAYCAATDISTSGMTSTQIKSFLSDLADQGVAAFYRNPGHDGWPSSEIRHIHAIYVGVPMKSSLRSQVHDWLNGKNGLVSHTTYTFWQASSSQKDAIEALFNEHN